MPKPYRLIAHRTAKAQLAKAFPALSFTERGAAIAAHCQLADEDRTVTLQSLRSLLLQEISAALVPADLQVKALFFDMDATVIKEESLAEVANFWGWGKEVAALTEAAMRGEIDFATSLTKRLGLLKGMPYDAFLNYREHLTLNPGIRELAATAKARSVKLFLVSGGFNDYASKIASDLGFDGYYANTLKVVEGKLAGTVVGTLIGAQEKQNYLVKTCESLGMATKHAVAIGDGANDALMMTAGVGCALGFHPKPALVPALDGANYSGDHRLFNDFLF